MARDVLLVRFDPVLTVKTFPYQQSYDLGHFISFNFEVDTRIFLVSKQVKIEPECKVLPMHTKPFKSSQQKSSDTSKNFPGVIQNFWHDRNAFNKKIHHLLEAQCARPASDHWQSSPIPIMFSDDIGDRGEPGVVGHSKHGSDVTLLPHYSTLLRNTG